MRNRRRQASSLVPPKTIQNIKRSKFNKKNSTEIFKKARGTPTIFPNFLARNFLLDFYVLKIGSD